MQLFMVTSYRFSVSYKLSKFARTRAAFFLGFSIFDVSTLSVYSVFIPVFTLGTDTRICNEYLHALNLYLPYLCANIPIKAHLPVANTLHGLHFYVMNVYCNFFFFIFFSTSEKCDMPFIKIKKCLYFSHNYFHTGNDSEHHHRGRKIFNLELNKLR